MELRAAVSGDAGVVAGIWYAGWRDGHWGHIPEALVAVRTRESFDLRAAERVGDTTVCTVDGRVVGFVMVVGDEVEQVYLASDQRGSGLAAELLAEAERQVRANGHSRAWLAVVEGNARARRFYERQGWVSEGPFDYQASSADGPIAVPCLRYAKPV
ncbi:GNAT family N-acetyltransferase [Kribbella sp. NBC_01245]|uniref:GNAT family N-acetyltransferase n=1 Tax=Kribbella sp. NBC_01245 TaxID=2903578 RepID=UPI002E28FC21|nr:GNAT family N-acetyltransferase [Kribbella sp. NBC_01245]